MYIYIYIYMCRQCGPWINQNRIHEYKAFLLAASRVYTSTHCFDNMQVESQAKFNNLLGEDKYLTLMGKNIPHMLPDEMIILWHIAGSHISMMYRKTILRNESNN